MSSVPKAKSESEWRAVLSPEQVCFVASLVPLIYSVATCSHKRHRSSAFFARKGWETPEEHVEEMVQIHNFLNEQAWLEILKWEKKENPYVPS